MTTKERARRIGDRIQEELATILQKEVDDPRLTMVTVTGVDVDRELAYATIFVSALEDEKERRDEVLAALKRARGFLRSALAERIQLRSFPDLRFRWDATYQHAERIEELLDQIKSGKKEDPQVDLDPD
ncbi:MAG: 30S ribosome-binding factor RbfA [Anaerolineales bacterium]|nr:30S ribosome-binding factor RbfA [Anaerolineales bacterium]